MGRSLLLGSLIGCILLIAATVRSDVAAPPVLEPTAIDEPITGTPAQNAPGDEIIVKDPFAPYDPGPADSLWKYEDLTPDEQAYVDRNRDPKGWDQINDAFAKAVAER